MPGPGMMKVDPLFDGWWLAVAEGTQQVHAGDEYDITRVRGPFPTNEMAEDWRWNADRVLGAWEHGLAVYADHCLGCGKFAKVLAYDYGSGFAWRVTECKHCGILDSRVQSEHSSQH